ncbi:unnamed protein product [Ectocarpus sp. 12 AP-2014]
MTGPRRCTAAILTIPSSDLHKPAIMRFLAPYYVEKDSLVVPETPAADVYVQDDDLEAYLNDMFSCFACEGRGHGRVDGIWQVPMESASRIASVHPSCHETSTICGRCWHGPAVSYVSVVHKPYHWYTLNEKLSSHVFVAGGLDG